MKRILFGLLIWLLLVSLGVVSTAAELPDIPWTPGGYSSDAADFTPAGNFAITWDPDAASKLDLSDGDMSDWAAADYNMVTIDVNNMVYWVNNTTNGTGIPEGWSISTFFVADSEWLYFGFYVTDPVFAYGDGAGYNGDAFQVCIDFGGLLGDQLKTDPSVFNRPLNVFYSFSCAEDGAPIQIMRQESEQDGWLSEENGDGVKGAAKKTESGWSAEFALSWKQLYDDYVWKAWKEDPKIYVGGDEDRPLKVGCCLYYLDRSATGGPINWAAGSTNGITDDDGTPCVSWTVYDNGIELYLPYEDGMTFACDGIQILATTGTSAEELPTTEPGPEPPVVTEPEPAPDPAPPIETTPELPFVETVVIYVPEHHQDDGVSLPGVLMFMAAASIVVIALAFKKKL